MRSWASQEMPDAAFERQDRPCPAGSPQGTAELVHWDDDLKGFGLHVSQSGRRTWIARYRVGTKRPKITIASVEAKKAADARAEAARIIAGAKLGHDERHAIRGRRAVASRPAAPTFGALARMYLEGGTKRQNAKTLADTKRYLEKHAAVLHSRELPSITRQEVEELLQALAVKAPVSANRLRSRLLKCFEWGVSRGLIAANPVAGIERPADEAERDRVLSPEELRCIWHATSNGRDYSCIVRLCMLLGVRKSEAAGIEWSELDEAEALWTLPGSRSKNRLPCLFPPAAARTGGLERGSTARGAVPALRPGCGTVQRMEQREGPPGSAHCRGKGEGQRRRKRQPGGTGALLPRTLDRSRPTADPCHDDERAPGCATPRCRGDRQPHFRHREAGRCWPLQQGHLPGREASSAEPMGGVADRCR